MKLPEKVRIANINYSIKEMPSDVFDCARADGVCQLHSSSILVSTAGQSDESILETLLHEISHAVHYSAGIDDDSTEEEVATRATRVWMQVWADNPNLLQLLYEYATKMKKIQSTYY